MLYFAVFVTTLSPQPYGTYPCSTPEEGHLDAGPFWHWSLLGRVEGGLERCNNHLRER